MRGEASNEDAAREWFKFKPRFFFSLEYQILSERERIETEQAGVTSLGKAKRM